MHSNIRARLKIVEKLGVDRHDNVCMSSTVRILSQIDLSVLSFALF